MSFVGELTRAEWDARRSRYAALATLLCATAAVSFLVLSVVNGLEETIGEEISQTLGGDMRLGRERTGLGDGEIIRDLRDKEDGLRAVDPSIRIAPRIETEAILLHGGDFVTSATAISRSAAVLVGIDPRADREVVDLDALIVEGRGANALEEEWRAPDGERLVPIIVGASLIETENVTVANGTFSWSSVYNVTAGYVENGRLVRERAIVVGSYATGFRMVDRLVVYAPRSAVARLLGEFPTEPPANIILVGTSRERAVSERAVDMGLTPLPAEEFRASYLGPVFTKVRVAAWSIVALLAAMTAGWMGYTLAHHVHEDRRKIATLRAVGIPDRVIERVYVALGAILAGGGAIAGVFAATIVSLAIGLAARSGGVFAPAPSAIEALILFVVSAATGVACVRYAYARAARVSIREALQAP